MADSSGLFKEKETINFVPYHINSIDGEKILQQIISVIDEQKQKREGTP